MPQIVMNARRRCDPEEWSAGAQKRDSTRSSIMTIRNRVQSWLVPRWVRKRFASGVLILLYHRVSQLASDPQWLSVTPQQFAEHLEVLRQQYHLCTLMDLERGLRMGRMPRKAVVITFDDGYSDNLHEAKPLLERYDAPATVFVTTGKLEGLSEFWWDELEALVLRSPVLPNPLMIRVENKIHSWEWDGGTTNCTAGENDRRWNVAMNSFPTPRHKVYRELAVVLREVEETARDSVLQDLARLTGVPRHVRHTHRSLRPEEIIRLADGGLVEVGAHSVTHSVLALQPPEVQRQEVVGSKKRLEEILGNPVLTFAYPFGTHTDYTPDTVAIVRQAGFNCACSNFGGMVERNSDLFQLPRALVRDWDGDAFAQQLDQWFCV
jgi:peptidoglycan/xylan/chitin deacetylase (PgdA/CDA1 family)